METDKQILVAIGAILVTLAVLVPLAKLLFPLFAILTIATFALGFKQDSFLPLSAVFFFLATATAFFGYGFEALDDGVKSFGRPPIAHVVARPPEPSPPPAPALNGTDAPPDG